MRVEHLEKTLDRLFLWIRLAEMRIPPIIAIDTTLLGLLVTRFPTVHNWSLPLLLSSLTAGLLLGTSLLLLALASFPRVSRSQDRGPLLWFGGIARMERDAFETAVEAMTEADFNADLIHVIHINSQIVRKKYFWIRHAWITMFCSLLPWCIAMYFLFQPNQP